MKKMKIDFQANYKGWKIRQYNTGAWEAEHEQTGEYVNFAGLNYQAMTRVQVLICVMPMLDDPTAIALQKQKVLERLRVLEDLIQSKYVKGKQLPVADTVAIGTALIEVKEHRLYLQQQSSLVNN